MAANSYDIGDIVRLKATFTSTAGVLKDPTKVTFSVVDPLGTGSTDTSTGSVVVNPSTGVFTLDVTADAAGVWLYKVNSTGIVTSAADSYFRVRHSRVST